MLRQATATSCARPSAAAKVVVANMNMMTARRDVLLRYVKAYRETLDWMYADPKAVEMWAANIGVPVRLAQMTSDKFQTKAARDFDEISGLDKLMEGATRQKFIAAPLTKENSRACAASARTDFLWFVSTVRALPAARSHSRTS